MFQVASLSIWITNKRWGSQSQQALVRRYERTAESNARDHFVTIPVTIRNEATFGHCPGS
jgi:hypothetical protein